MRSDGPWIEGVGTCGSRINRLAAQSVGCKEGEKKGLHGTMVGQKHDCWYAFVLWVFMRAVKFTALELCFCLGRECWKRGRSVASESGSKS